MRNAVIKKDPYRLSEIIDSYLLYTVIEEFKFLSLGEEHKARTLKLSENIENGLIQKLNCLLVYLVLDYEKLFKSKFDEMLVYANNFEKVYFPSKEAKSMKPTEFNDTKNFFIRYIQNLSIF